MRNLAISARASSLLVVVLDRLRDVEVHDETHVRFVYSHSERDSSDYLGDYWRNLVGSKLF
jgi:hypothetical protein